MLNARRIFLLTLLPFALACASARDSSRPSLAGTWRLVSFEDWDAAGRVTRAFGEHPAGYLVYDDTGRFFFNLMKVPPPSAEGFAGGSPNQEQKVRAFDAYASYFGRYSVDWDRRIVTHQVEGSLNPALNGTDQRRPFELSGDTLILTDRKSWRRVFVRAPPA